MYFELAGVGEIRRGGFQAVDVCSVGELCLQVAANEAFVGDQFAVLGDQFGRRLDAENRLEC